MKSFALSVICFVLSASTVFARDRASFWESYDASFSRVSRSGDVVVRNSSKSFEEMTPSLKEFNAALDEAYALNKEVADLQNERGKKFNEATEKYEKAVSANPANVAKAADDYNKECQKIQDDMNALQKKQQGALSKLQSVENQLATLQGSGVMTDTEKAVVRAAVGIGEGGNVSYADYVKLKRTMGLKEVQGRVSTLSSKVAYGVLRSGLTLREMDSVRGHHHMRRLEREMMRLMSHRHMQKLICEIQKHCGDDKKKAPDADVGSSDGSTDVEPAGTVSTDAQ